MIELQNDHLSLGILPELGAGIAYLRAHTNDGEFPILRETPEEISKAGELAGLLMMPWAHGISKGGITLEGSFYPLSRNCEAILPQNGNAWLLEWDVLAHNSTSVNLALDSSQLAPFDYSCTLEYALIKDQLEIRIALTHMGEKAVPYGFGLLFNIIRSEISTFKAQASHIFIEDASNLPQQMIALDTNQALNFNNPLDLPENYFDKQYYGNGGEFDIIWADLDSSLHIKNFAKWPYFVVTAPENEDFFTLAIATHAINAHHHKAPKEQGLVWLSNGQTMAAKCVLKLKTI